jgi:hypothetical protein
MVGAADGAVKTHWGSSVDMIATHWNQQAVEQQATVPHWGWRDWGSAGLAQLHVVMYEQDVG